MVKQELSTSPSGMDITLGKKKPASVVVSSGAGCCDIPIESGGYAGRLFFDFLPYFDDMYAITAQHEGIFSWYCLSRRMELEDVLKLEGGNWLGLKE